MVASKNFGTTSNTSLVGLTSGAYSISSGSAAVDRGTNPGAPPLDFFGNPRPRTNGNPVDIGAVEFQRGQGTPVVVTP
jgi:hypothetical protein